MKEWHKEYIRDSIAESEKIKLEKRILIFYTHKITSYCIINDMMDNIIDCIDISRIIEKNIDFIHLKRRDNYNYYCEINNCFVNGEKLLNNVLEIKRLRERHKLIRKSLPFMIPLCILMIIVIGIMI